MELFLMKFPSLLSGLNVKVRAWKRSEGRARKLFDWERFSKSGRVDLQPIYFKLICFFFDIKPKKQKKLLHLLITIIEINKITE